MFIWKKNWLALQLGRDILERERDYLASELTIARCERDSAQKRVDVLSQEGEASSVWTSSALCRQYKWNLCQEFVSHMGNREKQLPLRTRIEELISLERSIVASFGGHGLSLENEARLWELINEARK